MSIANAATSTRRQIQSSLSRWRGDLQEDEIPMFQAFVRDTLGRLRGPFLAQHHAKQILEYLEHAFRFAMTRSQGAVKIVVERQPSRGLIVMASMEDQPFIVDTIRLFLKSGDAEYWGGFNVVYSGRRDASGRLVEVGEGAGHSQESLVLIEADGGRVDADPDASAALLRRNLELARAMVEDFKPMTRVVERLIDRLEVLADRHPQHSERWRETSEFLKWLLRENFVFMGVDFAGEAMGIQRVPGEFHGTPDGDWPPPHPPETVRVRKSRTESPIHRAGRIDEILITLMDDDDASQRLFLRGMFTYRAVTQPCRQVPILRKVLADILEDVQSKPGSFRYKGIANVFDSLPTEFLFTASAQAIADTLDLVFESEQQHEVAASFLMTGPYSAFCLVAMPKAQFTDELRRVLEDYIVRTLGATYSDHGLFVGRYETVLLYYYLTGIENPGDAGLASIVEHIRELATPWLTRLWQALADRFDEATADRLTDIYGRAFPEEWVRNTSAQRAVRDIERMEMLSTGPSLVADVFQDEQGHLVLRLYQGHDIYLSDILPILDDFGLVVIDGFAGEVQTRNGTLYLDNFRLTGATGVEREDFQARRELLTRAIEAVFAGHVATDPMNRLILAAGLSWSEVDMLRGYTRYARQFKMPLSLARITEILLANPERCGLLTRLFHARFDPDLPGDRAQAIQLVTEEIGESFRKIRAHDEDLLFGTLLQFIQATVRTNYYRDDRVLHYLSFKLDCSKVRLMGSYRPMFEIYVHNKDVEGVHLRFGTVARGGLRWSDRDDYRTEVLGLATTQVVKNVVIVPVGAKGGFYLKNASRDPRERRQEADRHYQTFIRGLLDLTDNAVNSVVQPPPRVVRHDPDDPYLVVAADKGTAHLSDTANALSLAYGFWLGDAFASGGSNGYDHKKVGITARGGWVLAARHFMEFGRDPYTEPFTCVGIGDMGGDVFGNGLIETPQCKLVGAFNHLHIFLDPDPDPQRSFEERVRLFKAGREGGWDHYDTSVISEGGGVFDRGAKTIPLSPQAQEMLGLHQADAQPEVVIRHLLQMPVDLLWNGGIGTYIKATTETDADAGDRANDAVRIDGDDLRCRIIGEGGNLGMTQKGRIEAALRGVSLNTDFIDNSGGVDLSDHEVNLKILLDRVVARGDLTLDQRNTLLEEMCDPVAQLVLENNAAQGRQISRDRIRSIKNIFHFGRAIEFVERFSGRTREALDLPSDKELRRRADLGLGLTRPELAVLSAWVKMFVFRELMADQPKALPRYAEMLRSYFPPILQERYAADIDAHMLADEIAMTVATTLVIADAGASFIPVTIETTGRPVLEICAAYLQAQLLSKASEVRASLEQLRSSVRLNDLSRAWVAVDEGTRAVASFWLAAGERLPTNDELSDMLGSVDEVYKHQASEVAKRNEDLLQEMLAAKMPRDIAQRVLKAQYLNTAIMVWAEAKRLKVPLRDMAVQNLAVGRATGLQEVLDDLSSRAALGRWDPIALNILHRRFSRLLRNVVIRTPILTPGRSVDEVAPVLRREMLHDLRETVDELLKGNEGQPSVATLVVLEERLEGALARLPVR